MFPDSRAEPADAGRSSGADRTNSEGQNGGDGPVAMPMTEDFEVIDSYTDREAVEDGVLVPVPGEGGVNRVTRAVFDRFTDAMDGSQLTEPVTDITRLMEAIQEVVKLPADKDGWRTGIYQNQQLWLVPNEVGGLTMMFPEDY